MLSRNICKQYTREDGSIPVITLEPRLEELMINSLTQTEEGVYIAIPPDQLRNLLSKLSDEIKKVVEEWAVDYPTEQ